MVGQVALGAAGVARGTLPPRPQVPCDATQGVLAGGGAAGLPSMVRQITSPTGVPSPRQHGVGGDPRRGAESYPLQRKGSADLPVHEQHDVHAVQASSDVRLRTFAEGAAIWTPSDDQPTWLYACTRLLLNTFSLA